MRIAFLNPWRSAAENQAYQCLRAAAERIGHELVHCADSRDIETCSPDFVLATASTQAKLNDVPHYGVVHEPRDRFLNTREYFDNLRTYDGWLSISCTLRKFARDIAYSVGRDQEIGFYYNTCQRHSARADLETLLRERRLRITYFGTNWDNRRARLFRKLSAGSGIAIHGPETSWQGLERGAYAGEVPFDGESVQLRYAENGVGLCILSQLHLRDDVISNRVFEIASAGALVIACDMPWLRKYFGDSLYYVDQKLPDLLLAREIMAARERMYADPAGALQRAAHARHVFESQFAGEIMIANAVEHHCRVSRARAERLSRAMERYTPLVSVIIRCGTRPAETVRRAVESVARQTYGRFQLIMVRHHDLDLTWLSTSLGPNLESVQIVECPGGNCSRSLWSGLAAVEGDYFAVLDDDDWLFSNHFEQLFTPLPAAPQSNYFAFSGAVGIENEPREIAGGGSDNRHIVRFGISSYEDLAAMSDSISTNGFVASRDLLHPDLLIDPKMDTAEDSFLILSLLAQTSPRFTCGATSVSELGGGDRVTAVLHPRRFDDCLSLHTRLSGRWRPPTVHPDAWATLHEEWSSRSIAIPDSHLEAGERRVHADTTYYLSTLGDAALRCVAEGWHLRGSRVAEGCGKLGVFRPKLLLRTPPEPWVYAAELRFRRPPSAQGEFLLRIELVVKSGQAGVGLLDASGKRFLFRIPLRALPETQIVFLPVEDLPNTGLLVLQTWDVPQSAELTVKRVQLLAALEM